MTSVEDVLELAGDLIIKNKELVDKVESLEKLTENVEDRLFRIELERNWK